MSSLIALTREVSPSIVNCALTFLDRQDIDLERAQAQHAQYRDLLSSLGVEVITLPVEPDLPDSVFVEDTAVVVDEIAVMTRPRLASRQAEVDSVAAALAPFRPEARLQAPATVEGGDVIRIGRTVFVGQSTRSNGDGLNAMREILGPLGYEVRGVPVNGCLHLKTGASYLGRNTLLINPEHVDPADFGSYEVINMPDEGRSANVLVVGDTVIVPASAPLAAQELRSRGYDVRTVDASELEKAEAGLTCCSIVFRAE